MKMVKFTVAKHVHNKKKIAYIVLLEKVQSSLCQFLAVIRIKHKLSGFVSGEENTGYLKLNLDRLGTIRFLLRH